VVPLHWGEARNECVNGHLNDCGGYFAGSREKSVMRSRKIRRCWKKDDGRHRFFVGGDGTVAITTWPQQPKIF